ncbi:hypothetical protein P154DRAFT_451630 [Amniculicola lignicola CBS 123094]|uniref:Uncharacterized protein n=1 Tax=Amniculicola lignicola CBS 123094 TaxID=1392246 RepID=A0A6A5VU33_9PLEO|nr:hypothetical protein P154DRAFT_451630 [Amniculicola lignicola CBS 123094]
MATLAANDQENFVHNLQAGAVGKALNAGVKGLGAKTPGIKAPKTPFKVALNDENATFKAGKTNGKGNENIFLTGKKGGKLDENAFVTPAGPRTRAPLGMKTTNAKGKAFQTPAPLSASARTLKASPRLRRPKLKVHQAEAQDEEEDYVPEIEYMPPKEVPLPDLMDDYSMDINLPLFEGANVTPAMFDDINNPLEADGRTKNQREFEEGLAKQRKRADAEFNALFRKSEAEDLAEIQRSFGMAPPPKPAAAPKKKATHAPSTLKSRSAAAALSPASKPSYMAPTTAAKSRLPMNLLPSKKTRKPLIEPSSSRHAAATAASKSTIGYAQGRSNAPTLRKPLSNVTRPPSATSNRRPQTTQTPAGTSRAFSRSSSTSTNATLVAQPQHESYRTAEDLEHELAMLALAPDTDEDIDSWINSFGEPVDEFEGFQLQLPEGL